MLPGIFSKLDLDDATMWHSCQEIFLLFSESVSIQFHQVADIHLQHFQTGQDALCVSV